MVSVPMARPSSWNSTSEMSTWETTSTTTSSSPITISPSFGSRIETQMSWAPAGTAASVASVASVRHVSVSIE